ncbi:ABC transporter permease [Nocardioides mangrovi]|uniref:ABC transporter permease n=1 Tax=Nocardioides mangrovi TaxID=2874580 RepID=A0ABS7UL20_9ACTN|nr:ABC transporter permease [Nocardioides mangrovi]MBZ5741267.1 ABC transporter permease [Nocardioides mangrovi]
MLAYLVRRGFVGIILLLVLSLVTFFLFFATPVDVTRFACGKNCTPEKRATTEKALGYDDPTIVQWAKFIQGVFVGRDYPDDKELQEAAPDIVTHCGAPCFGYSQVNAKTVNDLIKEAAPTSISLALVALFIWVTLGILFGLLAAVTKGSLLDRGIVGLTLVVYAFPTFFVGIFLLKYVAIKWGWLPFPQYETIADGGIGGWLSNLLLPAVTLALFYLAGYVRITRAFVLESMSEDYIRTAKAKGLKQRTVLFKHALRAALTPLVTMVGLDFASLLGGAIITETVFSFHGLGALAVRANVSYDLPTLVGLLLLAGSFVILANIVVDVLYAYIDPRVRLD